ncbi:MAG: thioredoxin family protein [Bacteroidales bacterium]|nr:thioredoxin family protein [Bacteroidales bacterium]
MNKFERRGIEMKKLSLLIVMLMLVVFVDAQVKQKVYDPSVDAKVELNKNIIKAQQENKHIMLQIGFNRCPWCIKMHHFMNDDPTIDSLLKADYIVQKVNYSKENYNQELIQNLGFPNRFGFPVIVILDQKGNRIHTQNTVYLEEGKGYNGKGITEFLQQWNRASVDPKTYIK